MLTTVLTSNRSYTNNWTKPIVSISIQGGTVGSEKVSFGRNSAKEPPLRAITVSVELPDSNLWKVNILMVASLRIW